MKRLAEADAFGSLGLTRREALWKVRALGGEPLPLFAAADERRGSLRPELEEERVELTPMTAGGEVVQDYHSRGLTLRSHPVAFLRTDLMASGYVPAAGLGRMPDGRRVSVAGLVLVRQRPGSANGVLFITLEDETEIANLVVWPPLFEKTAPARSVGAHDRMSRKGAAGGRSRPRYCRTPDRPLRLTWAGGGADETFRLPHGRGDEAKHGGGLIAGRSRP